MEAMTMTRAEFDSKTFEELIELAKEYSDVTDYETLKEFAKDKIDDDNLYLAIHVIEAINEEYSDYYIYDYSMGTLETPTAVTCKEDIEHLFDIEEE